jgi:hypothetical protein
LPLAHLPLLQLLLQLQQLLHSLLLLPMLQWALRKCPLHMLHCRNPAAVGAAAAVGTGRAAAAGLFYT